MHQYDLFALKSLTSEEHFTTQLIPEKAKSLAGSILQSLRFFLPLESQDIHQRPLEHDIELLAARVLAQTVTQALHLKVNLTLSVRRFTFIFFKPSSPFDPSIMKKDSYHSGKSSKSNQKMPGNPADQTESDKSERVRLCILPALYALPEPEDNDESEDLALQSRTSYSRCMEEAISEDLGSLTLVARAIVLV